MKYIIDNKRFSSIDMSKKEKIQFHQYAMSNKRFIKRNISHKDKDSGINIYHIN
jgi:hypothetical protein